MNLRLLRAQTSRTLLLLCIAWMLQSCQWEAPITSEPTRQVDERLIGTWVGEKPDDVLQIYQFDPSHYVVLLDDGVYRAYHSEVDGIPFVSVQWIKTRKPVERKFAFVRYELGDEDNLLIVRAVSAEVVPATLGTSAEIVRVLKANVQNPKLFNEDAGRYRRKTAEK